MHVNWINVMSIILSYFLQNYNCFQLKQMHVNYNNYMTITVNVYMFIIHVCNKNPALPALPPGD